jgi:hypothetical protein
MPSMAISEASRGNYRTRGNQGNRGKVRFKRYLLEMPFNRIDKTLVHSCAPDNRRQPFVVTKGRGGI